MFIFKEFFFKFFILGCTGSWLLRRLCSLGAASRGYSLIVVGWLLLAAASLVAEHLIQGKRTSVVATPGL